MTKICLFAGTSEGRKLAEFLSGQETSLTVCVATNYGSELLDLPENVTLSAKRLTEEEMSGMFSRERFDLVIDATHPYADEATRNISAACQESDTAYQRLLRTESALSDGILTVPDIQSAAAFLDTVSGNILLTTGSKEIAAFSRIRDFSNRIYARVLPLAASLEACESAGLSPSHIIAMQGPFSEEMNIAMLNEVRAEWLVTKESGTNGGFGEKVSAAKKLGINILLIGRPKQMDGLSESEMLNFLCRKYGFHANPHISVIGIGPGDPQYLTGQGLEAIRSADCLIGAKRMLEPFGNLKKRTLEAIDPREISAFIRESKDLTHIAVLMSGDSSFFSGTHRLLPMLEGYNIQVLPGISSLSLLCARLRISSANIPAVSLHGRNADLLRAVQSNERLFVLTGGENNVRNICEMLADAGLDGLRVTVGERLSYPNERITSGTPAELITQDFDPLSVLLIENPSPDRVVTPGLPDSVFLRESSAKGMIPMTKSEIRAICLSKLQLSANAICWDIGAGTGSVAIEMALQAEKGQVFAIEKQPEAVSLIRQNADRLHTSNLQLIQGEAPEVCHELPVPTHVFIGGSDGKLKEIFRLLCTLGRPIRVVAAAVTMETVSEWNELIRDKSISDAETILIQTSRAKKAGAYHLMSGGNPVYVYSMLINGSVK